MFHFSAGAGEDSHADAAPSSTDTASARAAELARALEGSVIVSVQAPANHTLRDTATLTRVARACVAGGAPAIRCGGYGGIADIAAIAEACDVPVFGLTKEGDSGVYITPTVASVEAIIDAGAAVVCADATDRPRPDGSSFVDLVAAAHRRGTPIMADCADVEDVVNAFAAGADLASTTLAGYTSARVSTPGPDLACLAEARRRVGDAAFLIGEGRFHSPADVVRGFEAGASALIVGTAITDPAWITRQFESAARR